MWLPDYRFVGAVALSRTVVLGVHALRAGVPGRGEPLIYNLVRFRSRSDDDDAPRQSVYEVLIGVSIPSCRWCWC